ncbi:DNA polymerase/3'-5' exonuclease PolX [Candidatus Peregrinibacteria bacterium]|nr:DNA polymerase/3'-5' exonuclease PolX [Candidatus Peregrinibacteria bacterium]
MDNKKIAGIFEEMADILNIKGDIFFKINAYREASLVILNLPYDLRAVVDKNPLDLEKIPGIGKGLKDKITELIQTGKCKEHEDLKKGFPSGLLELLQLRGVGPKKVKLLYGHLKIKNIKELKNACSKHLVAKIPGMGPKTEEDILKAIDEHSHFATKRSLISEATQEALRFIEYLKKSPEIEKIQYAGSLRRKQETIGDIDILTTDVLEILSEGDTKSGVILESGIHVDLRVVDDKCFGAALHYFTGSKEHNIKIRDLAKKKGLKVSEYGVFKNKKMIAGKTEDEVFKAVGLPYIIPEIRRDDGEIEYGLKYKKFPDFLGVDDIKADLHLHTKYSDGDNSIEEMVTAGIKAGYKYLAITDHSSLVGVAGGMGKKDILEQWMEIDKLNKKFRGKIKILKGCEVDILKDGSLDFEDSVLKELDIVIASAHLYGRLPEKEQTARLIAAIENPYVKILGHPSGRLINRRAPMEFDVEKIIDACVSNKVALEINSNPSRLDLSDKYIKTAKDKGAKFVIDTDSHDTDQLQFMYYGVGIARRGWLTKKDVLNARSFKEFDSYF